jgi:hypothetical protein
MNDETTPAAAEGELPESATVADAATAAVPSPTEPAAAAPDSPSPEPPAVNLEAPAPNPEPSTPDSGQSAPDVLNEADSATEKPSEPIAQDAQDSPIAAESVVDAVAPTDATAAASVAQDGQPAATVMPDPLEELTAALDAKDKLAASLAEQAASLVEQNVLLQKNCDAAIEEIGRASVDYERRKMEMRTEIAALAEGLCERIRDYRQKALAVDPVASADRVRVVLRQPAMVAGTGREAGETLGVVTLAPGVTLNYLVDAVRNGVAKGR